MDAQSLRSDRALARARSLRTDRAEHAFGRCVATLFELLSDDSRFLRKDHLSGADSDFSGQSTGLSCQPSLLSREISSSPSRERTGSSRRRVTVFFCTGRCSGSRDQGRNSTRYGNSRRLGHSGCFALPAGSSTTPILVEDKERAADSMPPPPARKEIVLALRAPIVVPVAQPKGWKRKFTKGGDGESL
ncbi:hypothetical protein F2Q69_00013652 [Brassica cretica]|uniref:Uncharacterized protein n=1 Tax=Brassica cretica TaxID=69181 RepID=A0A8S9R537_BRACR|nr:hypothetical protein F2Q69_00014035 [Brassica cretica]KAF3557215.1 hypothetical protein F2Q69_00013652 [Brassica cretica]